MYSLHLNTRRLPSSFFHLKRCFEIQKIKTKYSTNATFKRLWRIKWKLHKISVLKKTTHDKFSPNSYFEKKVYMCIVVWANQLQQLACRAYFNNLQTLIKIFSLVTYLSPWKIKKSTLWVRVQYAFTVIILKSPSKEKKRTLSIEEDQHWIDWWFHLHRYWRSCGRTLPLFTLLFKRRRGYEDQENGEERSPIP